jgi:hypothetical protein
VHKCRYLAQAGFGVGLIDPHRTTAFALLDALEDVAADRVMFLDFDADVPVAFNAFDQPDEREYGRLATDYVHTVKQLFETDSHHRTMHILGNGVYALLSLRANLSSMPVLFSRSGEGECLRQRVIASVRNEAVRRFFLEEFVRLGPSAFAPIISRFSSLFLDDRTYRTFTQPVNRVDLAHAMDTGKIVIIAPPKSIEAAGIVGGLFIEQAKHAAFHRSGTPRARQHFHLAVDECHRFTGARTLQQILDECSKGGLSVTLANQETGQIPGDLLKALYSVPNIFVFGVNFPDAKQLAPLFHGRVTAETLASQATGEVHARIDHEIVNFQYPPPVVNPTPISAALIAHCQREYYGTAELVAAPEPARARVIETFSEDL